MPKETSEHYARLAEVVKEELSVLTDRSSVAAQRGLDTTLLHLLSAVEQTQQPSALLQHATNAVQNGVAITGGHLLAAGLDTVRSLKAAIAKQG